MKVFLDPIYTTNPQSCSMSYKMQTLARRLVESREDVFVYIAIPVRPEYAPDTWWATDEEWFFKHERVGYVPVVMHTDRMREYYRIPPELMEGLSTTGCFWDVDVLITCRVPMVPTYQVIMSVVKGKTGLRKVCTVDDMPILKSRNFISMPNKEVCEGMTLRGYIDADVNWLMSFWLKREVLSAARNTYTPSVVRRLSDSIIESWPLRLGEDITPAEKTAEQVSNVGTKEKPLVVAYVQRCDFGRHQYRRIIDVFMNTYAINSRDNDLVFAQTTVSKQGANSVMGDALGRADSSRDGFRKALQEDFHVVLSLSLEEDLGLSLIEPLLLGVPVVLLHSHYTDATIGEGYPFYVENVVQACAFIKEFKDDYEGTYTTFARWHRDSFIPLMNSRIDGYWPMQVGKYLGEIDNEHRDRMVEDATKQEEYQSVASMINESGHHVGTVEGLLEGLGTSGFKKGSPFPRWQARKTKSLGHQATLIDHRYMLIYKYGWRDNGLGTGKLRRV